MLSSAMNSYFLSNSIIIKITSLGNVATSRSFIEIRFEALTVSNLHRFDNDRKLVLCNLHKPTSPFNQQPPLGFRTIKSRNPIGFGHLQKLDYRLQALKNTVPAKLTFGKPPHAERGLAKNVEAWWCLERIERQLHQQGYPSMLIEHTPSSKRVAEPVSSFAFTFSR